MLMYSKTVQTDAAIATASPQRPRLKAAGRQRPFSRTHSAPSTGSANEK